jgi:hypothetical protein
VSPRRESDWGSKGWAGREELRIGELRIENGRLRIED